MRLKQGVLAAGKQFDGVRNRYWLVENMQKHPVCNYA